MRITTLYGHVNRAIAFAFNSRFHYTDLLTTASSAFTVSPYHYKTTLIVIVFNKTVYQEYLMNRLLYNYRTSAVRLRSIRLLSTLASDVSVCVGLQKQRLFGQAGRATDLIKCNLRRREAAMTNTVQRVAYRSRMSLRLT